MQLSNIPAKFNIPFANAAGGSYIRAVPQASQIGVNPGYASLTDGFPPLNFTPVASGGIPPYGQDMNGILNQSTAWDRWFSAGGPVLYDATFQAAVGGYPNGAIVGSLIVQGNYWMSTVDNNTTNPDTGGVNWITPPGMVGTGDWKFRPVASALPGWIISNGSTIGDASSGASQRANADCAFAFAYLWNNFSNTQCPVSTGRGANAAADFAAHKTIATFNMQATGIIGVDGMGGSATGLLANVPVVSGSATLAGSILGENLHALITAELAQHSHGITDPGHKHLSCIPSFPGSGPINTGGGGTGPLYNLDTSTATTGITINNTGSGTAHNNVQRSALVYWYMKL
jgi:hypothetical protein